MVSDVDKQKNIKESNLTEDTRHYQRHSIRDGVSKLPGNRDVHIEYLNAIRNKKEKKTLLENFSIGIKDVITIGTVIVSIATAWGMMYTRMALLEKENSILSERINEFKMTRKSTFLEVEEKIAEQNQEILTLRMKIEEVEGILRSYIYIMRRENK